MNKNIKPVAYVAYIAGKITNDPDYRAKFARAQKHIEGYGYIVMSPAILPDGFVYEDYIHIGLAMMFAIKRGVCFMLPDWKESGGAMREHEHAEKIGMAIKYLTWEDLDML